MLLLSLWKGSLKFWGFTIWRRIYTEDKAKVVAAVWGIYFIQFLAALAVLPPDNMKKRMSRTRMIWRQEWIHPVLQIIVRSVLLMSSTCWPEQASASSMWPRKAHYWSANSHSLAAVTPYWSVNSLSLTAVTPYWSVNSPSLTAVTPNWLVNSPSLTAVTPYWSAYSLSLTAVIPYWSAHSPSLTAVIPVHRQNVPRQNVPRDKMSQDKTSSDIRSQGQNVPRDKTSQGKKNSTFQFPIFQKQILSAFFWNGLGNGPHMYSMLGNELNLWIGLFLLWGG